MGEGFNVTPEEMHKYRGLLLYMAVLCLPNVSEFWSTIMIFEVPFAATIKPRNRVFAISSNFHISDPAEDVLNEKKASEEYDWLISNSRLASGLWKNIPHQWKLPWIWLQHILWQLLHKPLPLLTIEPVGKWGLWHLQANEIVHSIHCRKCTK